MATGIDGQVGRGLPHRGPQAFGDVVEPDLGLEGVVGTAQGVVEGGDAATERRVAQERAVHGATDQVLAEHVGLEVDGALPVAVARRRPAVVDDVRRQERDHRSLRRALRAVEVIADGAFVDEEQRPDVVGVGRVGVLGEPRLEDLADAGDGRLPRMDGNRSRSTQLLDRLRRVHRRRIVQDRDHCPGLASGPMNELLALLGFAFVSSVTPGPNNVMLWASGATFGVRRTTRHVVGTALGIGAMALAVAAGLGTLITTVPMLGTAMKVAGSAYLLYLAWQIARSGALQAATVSRPLGVVEAASFQLVNPKAWVFALGAITTFRPAGLPIATGSLLVAAAMMLVIVPTAELWAAGGGALNGLLSGARTHRFVSLALAAIVAATVVWVWI